MTVAPNRWIRRPRWTRLCAAVAVALSIAFAAIFFVPNRHLHKTVGDDIALGLFFFGPAGVGLVLARRLATAGVLMASDVVVVRNPLRTVTLALSDVEGFVPGVARGFGNGTPCPMLKRVHSRAIGIWALGRDGVVWRFGRYQHELQPLCDELNVVLRRLQSPC
jgi:hypothetical protein